MIFISLNLFIAYVLADNTLFALTGHKCGRSYTFAVSIKYFKTNKFKLTACKIKADTKNGIKSLE